MTALFTKPMAFTVVNSQQNVIAPASNAANDIPSLVWRSTNTAPFIIIDLGPNASYDTVALIGTNLRASDTVQIRTFTATNGSVVYDAGANAAFAGSRPESFTSKSVYQLGTRTERYIRIDIAASGHPEGAVSVQRIVVGKKITTLGFDYGAEQSFIDPSTITSINGADLITHVAARPRWKISISYVAASSWRNEWVGFLASVGKTQPILFVPNVEAPQDYQSEVIYGRIRNEATAKVPGNTIRAVELTIEALAP